MSSRTVEDRRKNFKKGIDADESRRRREEVTIALRKDKREEMISKRRQKSDDSENLSELANAAVGELSGSPTVGQIPGLMSQMQMQHDTNAQLQAVTAFRKLLSIEHNPPIDAVIACGAIPYFLHFLQQEAVPALQFEASWALTNIASGTSAQTRVVVEAGAIPIFAILLRSPSEDVREQAIWALGNIAGDCSQYRDMVLAQNVLPRLAEIAVCDTKIAIIRNSVWTISNLCRGKPQPNFELVSGVLPALSALVHHNDEEVLVDALWAVAYLSDDQGAGNVRIQTVLDAGLGGRLVQLLSHPTTNVKTPALRACGNIVTGNDSQTQHMLAHGILKAMPALLSHSKRGLRKEACWCLSNITAGSPDQIDAVLRADLISPMLVLLRTAEFEVKKEACWAISNATSGARADHVRALVSQGAIPALCDALTSHDGSMIKVALEAIENILKRGKQEAERTGQQNMYTLLVEQCGGLDKLEMLQEHEVDQIYQASLNILRVHFNASDVDEQMGVNAPDAMQNGFAFSAAVPSTGAFAF